MTSSFTQRPARTFDQEGWNTAALRQGLASAFKTLRSAFGAPARWDTDGAGGYDLHLSLQGNVHVLTLSGEPTFAQWLAIVQVIGVDSQGWERPAVVVDLRAVEVKLSRNELIRLGEEVASSMRHVARLALVSRQWDPYEVYTRTARRNGLRSREFPDVHQALLWASAEEC